MNYDFKCDPYLQLNPCFKFDQNYCGGFSNPCCPNPCSNMAVAVIHGGPLAPCLRGVVYFTDVPCGVDVCVYVEGLPKYQPAQEGKQPIGPFGFHIHEKGCCEVGDPTDPFLCAGGHWNPDNQPHGNHAGDFPVLFPNKHGIFKMCFFTDRFKVDDIINLGIIIHQSPDDYRTQPTGNSGKRLACGIIKKCNSTCNYNCCC